MTGHLVFLVTRGLRNVVLRQLRRLRRPRYALAALFGLAYFYFIFGGHRLGDDRPLPSIDSDAARVFAPVGLALLAAWWWLRGAYRNALVLLPHERDLLVPAPITRGQLLQYKILSAQPALVFTAAIFSLALQTSLAWPLRLLALWVMIATLHQHQIAASLVRASALEHGTGGARRQALPAMIFAVLFGALLYVIGGAVARIRAGGVDDAAAVIMDALQGPVAHAVLLPFRVVLAPSTAPGAVAWLGPFALALLVLALHYRWLLRTDAAFEEAAAEVGEKQADRIAAMRQGGVVGVRFNRHDRPRRLQQPWLPLQPRGRSAYAVFWKNVLFGQRAHQPLRVVALLLLFGLALGAVAAYGEGASLPVVAGSVCLGCSALFTMFGPLAIRQDLRGDLEHLPLLRSMPVPGADLVAAEIAGSTLLITVPQLIAVAVGTLLLLVGQALLLWHALVILAAALIVLPTANALLVTVQNAIVLLFPGWVRVGAEGLSGMEAVGQNLITMLATFLLLALMLLLPLLFAASIAGSMAMQFGLYGAIPGAFAFAGGLVGELVLLVVWLGRYYEAMDPAEAGLIR